MFVMGLLAVQFFVVSSLRQATVANCRRMGFPVLSIMTEKNKPIKQKEKYIKAEYNLDGLEGTCRIRGHGNSTWKSRLTSKKPYLLNLDEEQSLCGMNASRKWILMANACDRSMLRNYYAEYLSHNVWNSMKWNPSSKYIFLFLNGKFMGLYGLTEKIEIEPGRMNFEGDGFIAEVDSHDGRPYTFTTERKGKRVHIRRPADQTVEQYKKYEETINEIERTVWRLAVNTNLSFPSNFDKDSFVDWYLLSEFSQNYDSDFFNSVYMNYDYGTGIFSMGPLWDHDIAFGNTHHESARNPHNLYISKAPWFTIFLANKDFRKSVNERWKEKRPALEESIEWLKERGAEINDAAELTDTVWHILGSPNWPRTPGWKERKTHQSEIDYLVGWVEERMKYLDSVYGI